MKIERFEDIVAWQKARVLTLNLYLLFKENRDFSFRDQIQRASVSIMNNISEGYGRGSDLDFKRFLYIANGSCCEVKSMLYLAKDLQYITKSDFDDIFAKTDEIGRILNGLIKSLKTKTNYQVKEQSSVDSEQCSDFSR